MGIEIGQNDYNDDDWEPGGRLGNDERYVLVIADAKTERDIDRALGIRFMIRRWWRTKVRKYLKKK